MNGASRVGDEDDSRSVSPERVVPSSRRRREDNEDSGEDVDELAREETAKRIRLVFPKSKRKLVDVVTRISSADPKEVEAALEDLRNILKNEKQKDGTTVAFMQLGGHINLINAVKKHCTWSEIQDWACRIIINILHFERIGNLNELGGMKIVAANFGIVGAFDRIKHCLEQFNENECLVSLAVGACNNIFFHGVKQNASLFLEINGIELIVERMKDFSYNEGIQRQRCKIICFCIVTNAKIIKSLKQAGALAVVGAVMDHYPVESDACKEAKKAMKLIVDRWENSSR